MLCPTGAYVGRAVKVFCCQPEVQVSGLLWFFFLSFFKLWIFAPEFALRIIL